MHFSLGDLITELSSRPSDQSVVFDFGGFRPTTVDSYRGYYCDLALGFDGARTYSEEDADIDHASQGFRHTKVSDLLTELRSAIGRTFEGWKGGDFRMTEQTRLWVANPGKCSGTAIVGIAECAWQTVIATAYVDE